MLRIIKINKKNFLLALLALLGALFLIAGWGGFFKEEPQQVHEDNTAVVPVEKEQDTGRSEETSAGQDSIKTADSRLDYFVEYRLERQQVRGERMELLKNIVDNPASSAEERSQAQQEIIALSQKMSRESELENLIHAKGFNDAVVFLQGESVNIVINDDNVTSEEAARVCDLVARGTGISEQNIVIIPKKTSE